MRSHIGEALSSVFEQDYVTVAPVKDAGVKEFVGKDLKTSIAEWKSACAPRRPIWNSRKRPACATR